MKFKDRWAAGKVLAGMLGSVAGTDASAVVLAIPNGGLPVGIQIAKALNVPLGLMITCRINLPFTTESGFGAIAAVGTAIIDEETVRYYDLSEKQVATMKSRALERLETKMDLFGVRDQDIALAGKIVILVDDGIAGGYSIRASVASIAGQMPHRVIVAVPTAPSRSIETIRLLVDEVVCPDIKSGGSFAVADAYERWYDIDDDEALRIWLEFAGKGGDTRQS
jgi:predicted phosphoribosyltransferase